MAIARAPAGLTTDQVKGFFAKDAYEDVPLDGMRKTIAKRLTEAMQVAPHFYLTVDCELDALMKLRETLNGSAGKDKDGKPAFKLSVNDFVIKAMGLALTRVPAANAVWAEDRILRFRHSDVGVAVAIEGGLFTPAAGAGQAERNFLNGECAMLTGESPFYADLAGSRLFKVGVAELPYYEDVFGVRPANVVPDGAALWTLPGRKKDQ